MKFRLVSCLLGSVAGQAAAASAPPTTQIMGTFAGVSVANGDAGYVCALEAGRGAFQRQQPTSAKPNPPVLLAMPRTATYNAKTGAGYKASDGVVVLAFTTAVTGAMRIDFDYSAPNSRLPSGESVAFRAYKQVWDAATSTLRVSFDIDFAHCTLPVNAMFRSAP